jgi:hypothetical protein
LRQPSVAETAGFLLKSTALNRPNEDTNDPRYKMAGRHPRRGYLHGMLGCFFQSRTLNSSSEPRRVPEVSAGPIRRALQGRSPTAKMTQRRIPITPEIVICGGVPEHWEKSRELDLRLTDDATIPSSLPNSLTSIQNLAFSRPGRQPVMRTSDSLTTASVNPFRDGVSKILPVRSTAKTQPHPRRLVFCRFACANLAGTRREARSRILSLAALVSTGSRTVTGSSPAVPVPG